MRFPLRSSPCFGVPFTTPSLSAAWAGTLTVQKRIDATSLGNKSIYVRMNAANSTANIVFTSSVGSKSFKTGSTASPAWSGWKKLPLAPDRSNVLRLNLCSTR